MIVADFRFVTIYIAKVHKYIYLQNTLLHKSYKIKCNNIVTLLTRSDKTE